MSSSQPIRYVPASNTQSNNAPINTQTVIGVIGGIIAGAALMGAYQKFSTKRAAKQSNNQHLTVKPVINTARPGVFAPSSPAYTPRKPVESPHIAPLSPINLTGGQLSDEHGNHYAVIVVDPISTGANVAYCLTQRGYCVIRVLSGYVSPTLMNLIDPSIRTDFVATIDHDSSDPYKTIADIQALPFTIIGAISGSELGIEVTDFLTEALGLPTNGTELTNARRDKYQMGECVRRHGVRACKQARVTSWHQVQAFVEDLRPQPFEVIIKPIRSSGSDHVYLCTSEEDLRKRFDEIIGQQNQLGFVNDAVVVQEYLRGLEYVVDTVSRNGVHKVVALWEYDKRQFAGFNFVYFGMGSISGNSEIGKQLAAYTVRVLEALNIREGAGHGEVIMTPTGPCLVEIGARCHGCEGTFMPLADRVWGYNQVDAVVAATVSQEEFDALPDVCGDENEYGFKIDFVSPVTGVLDHVAYTKEISALPSFVQFDVLPKPGDHIKVTIDCFTAVGSVTLCHKSKAQVEKDHLKIREWEKTMFVVKK